MSCEMVTCERGLVATPEFNCSTTSYTPIAPTLRPAEITLAVLPPTDDDTKVLAVFSAGPVYGAPSTMACRAASGTTMPRPVAYTMIVSPATAGLSSVIFAPAMLAQHSVGLVGPTVTVAPVLEEPAIVIPLPSGPGTLAVR